MADIRNQVFFSFPSSFSSFFTLDTAPLYPIRMVYSLRSHHSVHIHLITNVQADNNMQYIDGTTNLSTVSEYLTFYIFVYFSSVCFLFYRLVSPFQNYIALLKTIYKDSNSYQVNLVDCFVLKQM